MRKLVAPFVALTTLVSANLYTPPRAYAEDTSQCISGIVTLPVLGGKGDSPIVEVSINGQKAGMYFSTETLEFFVREGGGVSYPGPSETITVITNGIDREDAQRKIIENFKIGDIDVGKIAVIQLSPPSHQEVSGIPIVGILGQHLLYHMKILLDLPHEKIFLLTGSSKPECSEVYRELAGLHADEVPMKYGLRDFAVIPLKINGKKYWVSPDPGAQRNVIPKSDLPSNDFTLLQQDSNNSRSVTEFDDFHFTGQSARLKRPVLGHTELGDTSVILQSDTETGLLGLPFFENHIALFDSENRKFYFSHSDISRQQPGHNLHFDTMKFASTSVTHQKEEDRKQ